jgi:hypothetical protein
MKNVAAACEQWTKFILKTKLVLITPGLKSRLYHHPGKGFPRLSEKKSRISFDEVECF